MCAWKRERRNVCSCIYFLSSFFIVVSILNCQRNYYAISISYQWVRNILLPSDHSKRNFENKNWYNKEKAGRNKHFKPPVYYFIQGDKHTNACHKSFIPVQVLCQDNKEVSLHRSFIREFTLTSTKLTQVYQAAGAFSCNLDTMFV